MVNEICLVKYSLEIKLNIKAYSHSSFSQIKILKVNSFYKTRDSSIFHSLHKNCKEEQNFLGQSSVLPVATLLDTRWVNW